LDEAAQSKVDDIIETKETFEDAKEFEDYEETAKEIQTNLISEDTTEQSLNLNSKKKSQESINILNNGVMVGNQSANETNGSSQNLYANRDYSVFDDNKSSATSFKNSNTALPPKFIINYTRGGRCRSLQSNLNHSRSSSLSCGSKKIICEEAYQKMNKFKEIKASLNNSSNLKFGEQHSKTKFNDQNAKSNALLKNRASDLNNNRLNTESNVSLADSENGNLSKKYFFLETTTVKGVCAHCKVYYSKE
jgi:hypothetical protein